MEIIKNEYKNTFIFLKNVRKYLIITVILFIAFSILGYFTAMHFYKGDVNIVTEHIKMFQQAVEEKGILTDEGIISVTTLFFSNFWATMLSVSFGTIPFLFLPITSLIINAVILGGVYAIMQLLQLGGAFEFFISIAPHGIFEIPALLIGIALGLKLCREMCALVLAKRKIPEFFVFLSEQIRAIILIIVPLLAVAAVIESYITPILMNIFIKV